MTIEVDMKNSQVENIFNSWDRVSSFLEFIVQNRRDVIDEFFKRESGKREEFLKEMDISKSDIKEGRVSDFDFDSFVKDLDVSN